MSNKTKFKIAFLLVFSIVIVWRNYIIVIGQTTKPVLVALNKQDSALAIIDPSDMKIIGKVPTRRQSARSRFIGGRADCFCRQLRSANAGQLAFRH